MKIQSDKQSAEFPVITGGLAMDRGYLGAIVWEDGKSLAVRIFKQSVFWKNKEN